MATINESLSYLTHRDGTRFQVLKTVLVKNPETGDDYEAEDWDEPATAALYHAYEAAHPA
jgi:hypothetical protein